MSYAPRVTASVIAGFKYSCAMFLAHTMNMRHHIVASISIRQLQLQCLQVSPDRAPAPMRPLNSPRLIVNAVKGNEVTSTSVPPSHCRDSPRMHRMQSCSMLHLHTKKLRVEVRILHQALSNQLPYSLMHRLQSAYWTKASHRMPRVLSHPCLAHFPRRRL